jgi:hypothetical protein
MERRSGDGKIEERRWQSGLLEWCDDHVDSIVSY